jgi:hypothetical protein
MGILAPLPIEFVRGDQFDLVMQYRESEGDPIDLTGAEMQGRIRWATGSMDLTVDNDRVIITNAVEGRFKFTISEVDTLTLPEGRVSRLSIIFVDSLGDVRTLKMIQLVGLT